MVEGGFLDSVEEIELLTWNQIKLYSKRIREEREIAEENRRLQQRQQQQRQPNPNIYVVR